MKIVSVVGARPQFIKCAAVSQAIAKYNNSYRFSPISIHHLIVHTGQHYDDGQSAEQCVQLLLMSYLRNKFIVSFLCLFLPFINL